MHLRSIHNSFLALALTLCVSTAFAAPTAAPAAAAPAAAAPATATASATATTTTTPAPAPAAAEPAPAPEPAPAAEPAPAPAAEAAPAAAAEPAPAPAAEPETIPGGPVPGSNPKYINLSLEDLEEKRDKVSLAGPIVMLAIGAPLAIIGTSWFIGSTIAYADCSYFDRLGYTQDANVCRTGNGIVMVLSGAMLAAGIPLSIIGGISLGKRIKERRALSKEIDLRTKGEEDYSLVVTPVYVPGGMGMGFQGTF